jgi:putative transposase
MPYDAQKHHRRSIRLEGHDYTGPGGYFLTIVSYQRENLFGEILNNDVNLNKFGRTAQREWDRLETRFNKIVLDAFVVMPNHVHGIILIEENHTEGMPQEPDLKFNAGNSPEKFGKPVRGSIATIARSYKSSVSYRINLMRLSSGQPVWQRNYYEHIIRNEKELAQLRKYILENPLVWEKDAENPRSQM